MIKPHAVGSAWRRAWWWLPLTGMSLAVTGMGTAAAQPSPAPGGAVVGITGTLNAVSAVSASDAWAVGSTGTTGNVPLIIHWNGTSWSRVKGPGIPSSGELHGVSMTSATNGWAVGWQRVSAKTIILHWDGTTWSTVPSPAPGRGALLG
jgi:hypothetical protein